MPQYRIRAGQQHYTRSAKGPGIILHTAGDIIELTEAQAHSFRDKLELIAETEIERAVRADQEIKVNESLPTVRKRDGKGYDVISAETGNPINDEPLSKKAAESLAESIINDEGEEESRPDPAEQLLRGLLNQRRNRNENTEEESPDDPQ